MATVELAERLAVIGGQAEQLVIGQHAVVGHYLLSSAARVVVTSRRDAERPLSVALAMRNSTGPLRLRADPQAPALSQPPRESAVSRSPSFSTADEAQSRLWRVVAQAAGGASTEHGPPFDELLAADLATRVALLGDSDRGDPLWALGQRYPEDQVGQDAEPAEEDGEHPCQPYKCRAEAEPLGDPARDAGDHPVGLRSCELRAHPALRTRTTAAITATASGSSMWLPNNMAGGSPDRSPRKMWPARVLRFGSPPLAVRLAPRHARPERAILVLADVG